MCGGNKTIFQEIEVNASEPFFMLLKSPKISFFVFFWFMLQHFKMYFRVSYLLGGVQQDQHQSDPLFAQPDSGV